ncbi:MAG: VWA domain-containing protein [Bacteroidetes bacterium]|nr:MAG: VWA domain-containing protein [Bacteroidota bacterium]
MKFENPDLLFLLWVVLLHAFLLWVYWTWRQRTLRRLGSPALAERLLQGFSGPRFWIKNILFGLALVLIVLAIANPRRAVKEAATTGQGADIILALDISQSMLAIDLEPSRLERAKVFAQKLVQALEGNRIGLIFFAGDAYPQMPLSTDYEALQMFLQNASPAFIANQGTEAASAVELADRMFESNSTAGRGLIVLSDGENFGDNAVSRAQDARVEGMTLYTVGVGTPEGGNIPASNRQLKRDVTGQVVRTRLDAAFLRQLATAGGGRMYDLRDGNTAIDNLVQSLDRLQKATVEAKAKTEYILYFQWLILPCLLFLMAEQVLWWRKQKIG